MRCASCDYPLWNLTARQCPECGTPFRPSEGDFVVNSVRFCCPHCDQAYYGTGPNGHLEPSAFQCVRCRSAVTMDEMVLRPAEGVSEEQTRVDEMPWLDRQGSAKVKGWFATIGLAMTAPQRVMRGLGEDRSVLHAWLYAALTWAVFLACGIAAPFLVIGIVALASGDPGGGAMMAGAAAAMAGGVVFWLIYITIWGLTVHAVLKLSGGTNRGIGRTYEALCYSVGVNAPYAIPCLGPYCGSFVGGIWWIVSAIFMVMTGHRVSGGRATTAVLIFPIISVLTFIGGYTGFTFWALGQATTGMSQATARQELTVVADALRDWAIAHDADGPVSGLELMLEERMPASAFIGTGTATLESDVPVGSGTLQDLMLDGPNRVAEAVAAEAGRLPEDVVAHRVGDVVFTHHGLDLRAPPDPGLWIAIMTPDPDVPGNGGPYAAAAALAAGRVEAFPSSDLPTRLAAQNTLRAQHGLPPLPDVESLPHRAR